jgi:alpha-beta hydrolase superfamily lysophospholipase
LVDYTGLEQRLFDELRNEVYDRAPHAEGDQVLRFNPAGRADPRHYPRDWNRTFELPRDQPRAGVLLLHGLTDSPYSLRVLANTLHEHGAWVVGLRIPGHGTAPAGLVDIDWRDYAAAVRIGARHIDENVPDSPFYMVGYSNGAALAVEYALAALEDPALPAADGLVLLSPAIGISRAAVLAVWQARLAHLPGLGTLAWNSILPEYDPFKYQSFAVNAGEQMYQLTREIASRIEGLNDGPGLAGFPPVLAFQSLTDATVIPRALVDTLMRNLQGDGHELVLFDVNRTSVVKPFLLAGKAQLRADLIADDSLPFTFTLITNVDEQSHEVMARRVGPRSTTSSDQPLGLRWPRDVYSLTHVALPFPPDDPLYGYRPEAGSADPHLGQLGLRGEKGVLIVSPGDLQRLRANPFFPYLEKRMLEHFQMADGQMADRPD